MAGFSELIKNFSKTREYVRDFFVYGCKVRSDFDKKSVRTYDDEKRRVESWMQDYMRYDDSVHGRSVSISVDSCHISENPLYNAYYSKSFTDNDIKLHFFLIDILCDGKSRTLRELTDTLNNEYEQLFDDQTVRNKLKEYTEEGIIVAEKQGKTMYYSLSTACTDEYIEKYKGLADALKFFSEAPDFGVIGNSIMKAVGIKNELFHIKHNYMIHALEDILVPEILAAIDDKSSIIIRKFAVIADDEPAEEIIIPMQILVSVQTGRRYIAAYVPKTRRFSTYRLDRIKQIKRNTVCTDYDRLRERYDVNIQRCFGVSFGNRHEIGNVDAIKITFTVDEKREPFIIERLEREKRCAVLEKAGDGLYTLTADVFDPNEIMHWAKTFIGRIVSIDGGTQKVRVRFYRDISRMYRMYGGGEDEHIQ
ncbi:MAG: WYL domain-containing protein [Ruminococcus sp.]|uniref:WYL domain-containing protein n=1 Tax=Ruminococcus sp. TaxID=41978 RepID=UPI0025D7038A|nr:WYL domain-containing protein [Ruminococcus sp.]MCR4794411.1 WYL domain-containing protein [Ruminococcus sp.]